MGCENIISAETAIHPLAELFPGIDPDTAKAFEESIAEVGTLNAVTLYEGQILDGKLRRNAARESGQPLRARKLAAGINPVDYVIAQNLERRHLDGSQRAMLVVLMARLLPSMTGEYTSRAALARRYTVPERSADRAARVAQHCPEEITTAVVNAEVHLSDAEAVHGRTEDEQLEALEDVRSGRAATLRRAMNARRKARAEKEAASKRHTAEGTGVLAEQPIAAATPPTAPAPPGDNERRAQEAADRLNAVREWLQALMMRPTVALGECRYFEFRGYASARDAELGVQPAVMHSLNTR